LVTDMEIVSLLAGISGDRIAGSIATYRRRVRLGVATTTAKVSAADLDVSNVSAFFVSTAAVDSAGHESLFAYPEYRCDASRCAVQPGSLDVTAKN
jgi:hypothetical protein